MTQKINKELIKIWKEYEKDTLKGVKEYEELSLNEKSKIFDLIIANKFATGEKHI